MDWREVKSRDSFNANSEHDTDKPEVHNSDVHEVSSDKPVVASNPPVNRPENTIADLFGDDCEESRDMSVPLDTQRRWLAEIETNPPAMDHDAYSSWLEAVRLSPPVTRKIGQGLEDSKEIQISHWWEEEASDWKKGYAMLACQFDRSIPAHLRSSKAIYDGRAAEWAKPILECKRNDIEGMKKIWSSLSNTLRANTWAHIMLYVLHSHPERAMRVCEATTFQNHRNWQILLLAVSHFAFYNRKYRDPTYVDEALASLQWMLSTSKIRWVKKQENMFRNRAIRLLLVRSNTVQVARLFSMLQSSNGAVKISPHTFLHFSYKFAMDRLCSKALSALQAAIDLGAPVDSYPVLSVCNVILRMLMAEADGYQSSLDVVSRMLEMNIPLTPALTSVLVLNAVEADDLPTAIGLYEVSVQNNLEPTSYTFDFLLRGLRKSDDADLIHRIVVDASEYVRKSGDSKERYYVANAILCCVGAYHMRQSRLKSFDMLMNVYLQYFDPTPLIQLGIPVRHHRNPEVNMELDVTLLTPDPATLHIMMHSYLLNIDDTSGLGRVWGLWKNLTKIAMTDPLIAECLEREHFYNTFIEIFGRRYHTLRFCPTMLKEMVSSGFEVRSPSGEILKVVKRPEPSVWTMNTLLFAFVRQKRWDAAEKIRAMMRQRNIPVTGVTWNTIINMHSSRQDEGAAAKAVRQMELEGWQITRHTTDQLQRIRDREKLQKALERTEGQAMGIIDAEDSAETAEEQIAQDEAGKKRSWIEVSIFRPEGDGESLGYTIKEPGLLKPVPDRSVRKSLPRVSASVDDDPFANPIFPPNWPKEGQVNPEEMNKSQERAQSGLLQSQDSKAEEQPTTDHVEWAPPDSNENRTGTAPVNGVGGNMLTPAEAEPPPASSMMWLEDELEKADLQNVSIEPYNEDQWESEANASTANDKKAEEKSPSVYTVSQ
ncbi:hypothetical protein NA57DRAFT_55131 [Rhizodiscina lignyota]|uniref:Pentacotripeptide-repeat region of PRORP domain-containing protein n=1 Tax=Rhizodiscina lignyota TaxID=1504668 RepID=A0A9P4MB62_9PEZI|nr:hypothetical protein NA57DRAFT_55131 [Rhizodiscina lignyota]